MDADDAVLRHRFCCCLFFAYYCSKCGSGWGFVYRFCNVVLFSREKIASTVFVLMCLFVSIL